MSDLVLLFAYRDTEFGSQKPQYHHEANSPTEGIQSNAGSGVWISFPS